MNADKRKFPFATLFAWLLVAAGAGLAVAGLLLDAIAPTSSPGVSLPQILVIAGGAGVALFGWRLRRLAFRRRMLRDLRANGAKVVIITLITLLGLELALRFVGMGTYYPAELPEARFRLTDWWQCDELGCRADPPAMSRACAKRDDMSARFCHFNAKGFYDTDAFSTRPTNSRRLLFLGDSFTAGFTADPGMSFVESVERALPAAAVWNLGVPGTGTNQAVASYRGIAPIMQPQLTILGFYPWNDFDDSRVRLGSLLAITSEHKPFALLLMSLRGRFGLQYRVNADLMLRYRSLDKSPPPNEIERVIGSTQLGTLLLRGLDALDEAVGPDDWQVKVDTMRGFLSQLRDEAAAIDSQMFALLVPSIHGFDEPTEHYTTALQLLSDLNIPYLEVIDELDLETDYMPLPDDHWNNAGHGKVGAILADCIKAFFAAGNLSACDSVALP